MFCEKVLPATVAFLLLLNLSGSKSEARDHKGWSLRIRPFKDYMPRNYKGEDGEREVQRGDGRSQNLGEVKEQGKRDKAPELMRNFYKQQLRASVRALLE
ncbi:unnamed protein product [Pocillopora meandrina]|uniref:Uncharacterized protein n=1 Tax=Pocillopora meandrina TaxID=46732 RepID=A0AAU9WEI5_9CNID|nr:unnamed protein product [Pocillopora meandrina]